MTNICNLSEVPSLFKDSKLCGYDASYPVHSVLMAVHSEFLRKTLKSIPDQLGTVFIVTDFKVAEITTLVRVMNGWDKSGCVSESLLKTLGFFSVLPHNLERRNLEFPQPRDPQPRGSIT